MYRISAPSKTFLLGEYAVLDGGHGLIIGSQPRFIMDFSIIDEGEESSVEGISPAGPVMDYLKDHLDIFSNFQIKMIDPHEGKGGFGWSSAQFLFLYALKKMYEANDYMKPAQISKEELLQEFLNYSWDGKGWAPSGLDIISQLEGGILFLQSPRRVENGELLPIEFGNYQKISEWPFKELDFCLVRTGNKLATHTHLSNLQDMDTDALSKIAKSAGESLITGDEELFLEKVNEFRDSLLQQDLVDPNSWSFIQTLMKRPEVLAVKGCGALGADVILCIVVPELREQFEEWVESEEHKVVANNQTLSPGLTLEKVNLEVSE